MNFIVQGYPAFAYTGGRDFDPAKPAIVFLHGVTVLAVDLPAHGRSPGPVRATIGGFADWVNALLDAATLDQATLVGHSMGSLIALESAIRFSHRVQKLALIGTSVPMPVGEAFLAAAADDDPAAFDMEVVWGHARAAALTTSPVPGTALMGASRALNGRARKGVLHADLAACHAYTAAPEALAALPMPTLVLAGTQDQMTPWRAGEAVAKQVPGARFEKLPAGHSMMAEAPRATLEALRRFLL